MDGPGAEGDIVDVDGPGAEGDIVDVDGPGASTGPPAFGDSDGVTAGEFPL